MSAWQLRIVGCCTVGCISLAQKPVNLIMARCPRFSTVQHGLLTRHWQWKRLPRWKLRTMNCRIWTCVQQSSPLLARKMTQPLLVHLWKWRDGACFALITVLCQMHRNAHKRATETLTELFVRSEEHTSELQSLMRISYAVFCVKKKMILFQQLST